MFQCLLAFLLINSYYLSLGNPIQQSPLISESLTILAAQCENSFLSNAIKGKINDCAVSVPPYNKKQIRCLIFYDINKQLCSAVAASKLAVSADIAVKIFEKQDVNTVCTEAKDWIFNNISEYASYKNSSEELFKLPATCGEICGVEESMNEANEFCKYYKWGIDLLKAQVSTAGDNVHNNAVDAPNIPEVDSNSKADIPVPINNNQLSAQTSNTNTLNVQIKQTESTMLKISPEKTEDGGVVAVVKSTPQATSSRQPVSQANVQTSVEKDEADVLDHPIDPEADYANKQSNKSTVTNEAKPDLENDPPGLPESGNMDTKKVFLEDTDGKAANLPDVYADSEGNDQGDEDADDMDMKGGPELKQDSPLKTKLNIQPNNDISQKEYYPNIPNPMSDSFADDGDHFLPFFLTAVIMVVLLYVLYHNKSKVSKVFFGLILEGRQSSRRRNSRGHAYRRLDTLEQAMSANTAAPPSKIIY